MEDVLHYLRLWFKQYGTQLDEDATKAFHDACQQVENMAQDEIAYAVTQCENDYDGWVSPDELEEFYIALPIGADGYPIHDVQLQY